LNWRLLVVVVLCYSVTCIAQDIPPVTEQQLENLADVEQAETEDDTYLQQLVQFRKNPLNLNTADRDDLRELRVLTDLQIENFISYRRLFGTIISVYELQAVPAWDIATLRRLLPFITVSVPLFIKEEMRRRFREGEHSLLLRTSQVIEKAAGFDHSTPGTKYLGSPQRLFFRYRYSYKNLLQFGLLGDKDAGEQFFSGSRRNGFDFYSFHLFIRKAGIIQSLALGDFTVNMGQGLIQWQSLAFKKSAGVMGIKRQSPVLRPYNSAGEYNFHRGAGITIRRGKLDATAFVSLRKLSANFAIDSFSDDGTFSSFQMSGYHRTQAEMSDRNNLQQIAGGAAVRYMNNNWHVGINGIYYKFSLPLQKRDEPYNLFAISGDRWYNASAEYSYTHRNFHFFGEVAIDKNFHKAILNGLLISVDPKVDISLLHRTIAKDYQAVNGNAFTENLLPSSENGIYGGLSLRPSIAWRLDAYADIYTFPWLKYRVDAPGAGRDFFVQLTYAPNRQTEIYTRFRNESKQGNQTDTDTVTNFLGFSPRQNWRLQVSYQINPVLTLRNRVELVWYNAGQENSETGFLLYMDFLYKPLKPLSGALRLQYFETDGYNARIYAYENDVLYSYSIPVFFDKGYRYYLLLNYELNQKISFWIRWAQTIYPGREVIGSGADAVKGNKKTEVKLQARWIF
jgi:DNA uptake protein ComE-like DNA-binding protein